MSYESEYRRSIEDPQGFWAEQARAIDWHKPPQRILDYSNPPFRSWFCGGETNLCHNAVDRHLDTRGVAMKRQLAFMILFKFRAMTHADQCGVFEFLAEQLHHRILTFRVQCRGCFIHDDDVGLQH